MTYRIWLDVSDSETEEPVDLGFGHCVEFDDLDEACEFAFRLNEVGRAMERERKAVTP